MKLSVSSIDPSFWPFIAYKSDWGGTRGSVIAGSGIEFGRLSYPTLEKAQHNDTKFRTKKRLRERARGGGDLLGRGFSRSAYLFLLNGLFFLHKQAFTPLSKPAGTTEQ